MLKLRLESLEQMLFLLTRIRVRCKAGDSVTEAQKMATRETSKKYGVEGPTISDLQTRRLGIKGIVKWRGLLEDWISGDSEPLKKVLLQSTEIANQNTVRVFFDNSEMEMISKSHSNSVAFEIDEGFDFNTSQDTAKKIKVLALMSGVSESEWLGNNIPEMVDNLYNHWLESQKG